MQPRIGAAVGCPYGHELELLDSGVTLWGQDFFWTIAKPLAEFEPDDQAITLAQQAWTQFLESGRHSQEPFDARLASSADELKSYQNGSLR